MPNYALMHTLFLKATQSPMTGIFWNVGGLIPGKATELNNI